MLMLTKLYNTERRGPNNHSVLDEPLDDGSSEPQDSSVVTTEIEGCPEPENCTPPNVTFTSTPASI